MSYRRRIYFTAEQKSEIWDRWQRGESMSSIGRGFERDSSSIYPLLSRTGGIRPPDRHRSRLSLTLVEREEISRGLKGRLSLRCIARHLQRSARPSAAKLNAMAGLITIERSSPIKPPGTVPIAPSFVSWLATNPCAEHYPGSSS
jgi:DNA-binding CsgD family transcriptional regulator